MVNYKQDISDESLLLNRMTQTLHKRGPDAFGYYVSEHAMMGHRRLVVVDPAGGGQPMERTIDDNTYTIVYNGELYNTDDIRNTLVQMGFEFESYSDTEVLLAAYIAWDVWCVNYINGIFSFAIWDEERERLFLCRDHLGVKPLYYMQKDDWMIFGSEIKAIMQHPVAEPIIDETGICEIFGLGPAHSLDNGVFKDVKQLPPAHWMVYQQDSCRIEEYWKLEVNEHTDDENETGEHVRELLTDAIKRQLVSDVPVCTFLSGGLDSSVISAVASKEFSKRGEKLNTYSIDYEGNSQFYKASDFQPTSDDEWVDIMSEHIGSNHHRVVLNNNELVAALQDAVNATDMPGMADIDSSLFLFCKEVRKDATVALSGECADEIFGGYPWYLREDLAYDNTFPWSGAIRERQSLLNKDISHIDLDGYVQSKYEDTVKKAPMGDSKDKDARMKKLFYLNIKWFMNTLLTRKDRMSMATSLEVRVPFADHRLVEYAFNIPKEYLFYGSREKGILRKALNGILPQDILWRKKSPYPKTFNPQYIKGVRTWMEEILSDNKSPVLDLIDMDTIKKIVDTEGRSFKRPWFGQLMTGPQLIAYLIQLDIWLRRYKVKVSL